MGHLMYITVLGTMWQEGAPNFSESFGLPSFLFTLEYMSLLISWFLIKIFFFFLGSVVEL